MSAERGAITSHSGLSQWHWERVSPFNILLPELPGCPLGSRSLTWSKTQPNKGTCFPSNRSISTPTPATGQPPSTRLSATMHAWLDSHGHVAAASDASISRGAMAAHSQPFLTSPLPDACQGIQTCFSVFHITPPAVLYCITRHLFPPCLFPVSPWNGLPQGGSAQSPEQLHPTLPTLHTSRELTIGVQDLVYCWSAACLRLSSWHSSAPCRSPGLAL